MEKRFRKISIKPGEHGARVLIQWEQGDPEQPDEHSAKITDDPHPEFTDAMQALSGDVLDLCELAESDDNPVEVRGLSISYDKDGFQRITITALRSLLTSNAPLVLNTPNRLETEFGLATRERLDAVLEEAQMYLDGKRASGDLFEEFGRKMQDSANNIGGAVSIGIGDQEAARWEPEPAA